MATNGNSNNGEEQTQDADNRGGRKTITVTLDGLEDVGRAARDALGKSKDVAANVGESIQDTIRTVRDTRDSVVMVRVNKESLRRMDELVDCGLTNSRSAAAAFLITEGIKARADLYGKIAEQSEVIRNAREKLRKLLDDDGESEGGES